MLRNINHILQKVEMQYNEIFLTNKHTIKHELKKRATQPDWRCNIVKELLDLRDNQLISNLDQTEIKIMLKNISTFREDDKGML